MIDERVIMMHKEEMAEHANGTAQFLGSLIGGQEKNKLVKQWIFFLLQQNEI